MLPSTKKRKLEILFSGSRQVGQGRNTLFSRGGGLLIWTLNDLNKFINWIWGLHERDILEGVGLMDLDYTPEGRLDR